jgi:ferritin
MTTIKKLQTLIEHFEVCLPHNVFVLRKLQEVRDELIDQIDVDTEGLQDKVVETVIQSYKRRSALGIEKYGKTMEREDLSTLEWLQHFQEEMMDATLYVESLKRKYRVLTTGTMKNIEL